MAIKAVFFDIDGTLLTDVKTVSKSTQDAIKSLKKQGILVGVATGRGPSFVNRFMENLELDFAISYNGQFIFTRDKVLYQNPLPKSMVYRVITYASDKRREISLGTASGLVGSNIINMGTSRFGQIMSHLVPKRLTKTVGRSFKHVIRRLIPQNSTNLLTIMREPIYQIVLVATAEESQKVADKFPHLKVTRSSPYSADLISYDQSKLKGIEFLGDIFQFSLEDVMAFGDSDNDCEMLSGVGLGVAMGNATSELKKSATYTTSSNNHDGIAKALAHHGLIHLAGERSFVSRDDNFNKVKDFHRLMDKTTRETPRIYHLEEAGYRSEFKLEEIVEFMYAAANGNNEDFENAVLQLHEAIDKAAEKIKQKPSSESPMVAQVDALTDLLYLTYGSFVLMGVDVKPLFDTVHEANMKKLFPDGNARFDPKTHKILKPDDWAERFAPEPALKRELNQQIQKSLKHR